MEALTHRQENRELEDMILFETQEVRRICRIVGLARARKDVRTPARVELHPSSGHADKMMICRHPFVTGERWSSGSGVAEAPLPTRVSVL